MGSTSGCCELGLKGNSQQSPYRSDGTHVEDVKDPGEVQPPDGDHRFVVLRVEELRNGVPFAPLSHLPLDRTHNPMVERLISDPPGVLTPPAQLTLSVPRSSRAPTR